MKKSVFSEEIINLYKNDLISGTEKLNWGVTKGQFYYYIGRVLGWDKSPLLEFMYSDITMYDDYDKISKYHIPFIRHAVTQGFLEPEIIEHKKEIKEVLGEGIEITTEVIEYERKLNTTDYLKIGEMNEILNKISYGYSTYSIFESSLEKGILNPIYFNSNSNVPLELMFKVMYDLK